MTPLISVGMNFYDNFPLDYRAMIHEFVKEEVAAERERCARVAEGWAEYYDMTKPPIGIGDCIAAKIREEP